MTKDLSVHIIHLDETDSTNRYLKEMCKNSPTREFTTVYTDFQSAGHGQGSNVWESERGKNLLFSYVLYPDFCPAYQQFYLSQLVSLAIKDTLSEYADGFSIKWPNDIYWHDQKICGILIENELRGEMMQQCIPGIGININQKIFKSDAPNPVSLYQIIQQEKDPKEILERIMQRTLHYYILLKEGEITTITEHYFDSLYRKDGYHPYEDIDGPFNAKIIDIQPMGCIVLKDEEGFKRSYHFKEVSFLKE
jgi:BirA family biotin operon repressor/biotin-[acetyl-CoA-carboxylase] ligase